MVFTNEKCVGCNKCIRSCPVLTANVAEDEALLDSIYSMNARVVNIAATTEEISTQSDTIRDLSDGIQGEVNAI